MSENPGKVVTKLQFSSLLHEAWIQSVQPETIRSGFLKVAIYPFDAKAINPLTSPQVTASEEEHSPSDTATQQKGDKLNESVCSSNGINLKDSNISFTEDQVSLFQQRYDNGYNLYHDKMYVSWLRQEHLECLSNDLITSTSPGTYSCNTECSGVSPLDVQAPTQSLSVSLSQTRSLLSELSEFLNQPKAPVKAKGKKSTARVLTSAESLSILIEKEKKKKEKEEAKAKRKEERERGRKRKGSWEGKEAEIKKKKEEEAAAKKQSTTKQSNAKAKKVPVVSNIPSDSDSQGSGEDEDGVQSHEISNNECAVCFGLYQVVVHRKTYDWMGWVYQCRL